MAVPQLRLGVLASHPIQYHAPLHRTLAAMPDVSLTVYFAHRPTPDEQGVGFGIPFAWDEDFTAGYHHVWLPNAADARRARTKRPFRDHFLDYDVPEITGIIAREGYDAFLLHGWRVRADWQALRACEAQRIPVLVRGDSQLNDDDSLKRSIKRVVYPRFVRRFAACLSVGRRSEEYFRYYGARHIVRSPHFVDNDYFAKKTAAALPHRDVRRTHWRIPLDALVVAFVGKLIPRKRPQDLIRALQGLASTHALFVGDGPLRAECEDLARRLGVPATFAGFLNQSTIGDAYASADALVVSSDRRETWGLAVNEAMAAGRPAVVSDAAGCAPDLIEEGVTGYTYPAGNVGALRNRIERLLRDPEAMQRMGAIASTRIAAYSPAAAAAGVVQAATAAAGRAAWP
jgi:glycosyltransferase involved in cell wall biosynthesis